MIIKTRTLEATHDRPTRIVATDRDTGSRLEMPRPAGVDAPDAHAQLAKHLARALGASEVRRTGEHGSTGYVFQADRD